MTKTLLLDIETAPNIAYVWGLWDQNISHNQLVQSGYILCWAAKWLGRREVLFQSQRDGNKAMLAPMAALLSEADIVIHYNGLKFDIPTLNKEFLKHRIAIPAPYKQVDLLRACRRAFRFESNKLDYVCTALGIGHKVRHPGFEMWVQCMAGKPKAWAQMEKYNRGDVRLLERLYHRLLPWIDQHPNISPGGLACPKCGSGRIQRRGTATALSRAYTRYQCQKCGGWFRGTKAEQGRRLETTAIR